MLFEDVLEEIETKLKRRNSPMTAMLYLDAETFINYVIWKIKNEKYGDRHLIHGCIIEIEYMVCDDYMLL